MPATGSRSGLDAGVLAPRPAEPASDPAEDSQVLVGESDGVGGEAGLLASVEVGLPPFVGPAGVEGVAAAEPGGDAVRLGVDGTPATAPPDSDSAAAAAPPGGPDWPPAPAAAASGGGSEAAAGGAAPAAAAVGGMAPPAAAPAGAAANAGHGLGGGSGRPDAAVLAEAAVGLLAFRRAARLFGGRARTNAVHSKVGRAGVARGARSEEIVVQSALREELLHA